MKIVIVGDGKMGYALTEQLSKEEHDIVVIDSKKSVLRESMEALDVSVVHGNGACLEVQEQADVGTSDLLIAATSADEINLLCCIIARKLGCRHTIARVRNPEYAPQLFFLKEELGLSMTINPERATAGEIFRMLQFPSFLRRDPFAKGRVEIVEIDLQRAKKLIGKKLLELYKIIKIKVLVCAVERGENVYIPDGNFQLEENDKIYVTASAQDLTALIRNLDLNHRKIREVILIGGGSIAFYLARELLQSGVSVKIIEIQEQRCQQLADLLPEATIIHADGTSRPVLLSEGIEQADAVVTLTGIDEENLILSMYAEYMGVPTVVTKINRIEYGEMLQGKGISTIVSPKQLCTNDIVRYVRAMQNTSGGSVLTLHRLVKGKVEALEFHITELTWHLGETLAEIALRPNILISCINRRGRVIIPKGRDTIELGDTVIVVASSEEMIHDINDIFADSALLNKVEAHL